MKYNELFPTEFNPNPKLKNRFFNYYKTFFKEVGIKKKTRPLKYLSLFTGIGGFEVTIQSIFPNAECIGYSEIKKSAIEVYNNHFPGHKNLGNVTEITKEQIQELVRREGCDLIVGGFPCTNLSSYARSTKHNNDEGLNGPKSGLFWTMCNIMQWVHDINNDVDILIENNGSMKIMWRELITKELNNILKKDVIMSQSNSLNVSVQRRNRLYWTTFQVDLDKNINLELKDILIDTDNRLSDTFINNTLNGIWKKKHSRIVTTERIVREGDYIRFENIEIKSGTTRVWHVHKSERGFSKCITTQQNDAIVAIKIDNDKYILRKYENIELERLFMFPSQYIKYTDNHGGKILNLYGNSVIVTVIQTLLNSY